MATTTEFWIQPPVGKKIVLGRWDNWCDALFERGITNPGQEGTSTDPDTGLVTSWGRETVEAQPNRECSMCDGVAMWLGLFVGGMDGFGCGCGHSWLARRETLLGT